MQPPTRTHDFFLQTGEIDKYVQRNQWLESKVENYEGNIQTFQALEIEHAGLTVTPCTILLRKIVQIEMFVCQIVRWDCVRLLSSYQVLRATPATIKITDKKAYHLSPTLNEIGILVIETATFGNLLFTFENQSQREDCANAFHAFLSNSQTHRCAHDRFRASVSAHLWLLQTVLGVRIGTRD